MPFLRPPAEPQFQIVRKEQAKGQNVCALNLKCEQTPFYL